MGTIGFFGTAGKYGCFSNFFPCTFIYAGQTFKCSEQAFMWAKARVFNDEETAELILKETDPKKIKALGRKVKNYDDNFWSEVRQTFMLDINIAKYHDNKDLLAVLLSTNNDYLYEASPYDSIWGVGKDGKGQNLLGLTLMKVREIFSQPRVE